MEKEISKDYVRTVSLDGKTEVIAIAVVDSNSGVNESTVVTGEVTIV